MNNFKKNLILAIIFFSTSCNGSNVQVIRGLIIPLDTFDMKVKALCENYNDIITDSTLIESIRVINTFMYYDSLETNYSHFFDCFYEKYSERVIAMPCVKIELKGFLFCENNICVSGRKHSNSYYSILGLTEKGRRRSELIKQEKEMMRIDSILREEELRAVKGNLPHK
jgi:hypothetical protein